MNDFDFAVPAKMNLPEFERLFGKLCANGPTLLSWAERYPDIKDRLAAMAITIPGMMTTRVFTQMTY